LNSSRSKCPGTRIWYTNIFQNVFSIALLVLMTLITIGEGTGIIVNLGCNTCGQILVYILPGVTFVGVSRKYLGHIDYSKLAIIVPICTLGVFMIGVTIYGWAVEGNALVITGKDVAGEVHVDQELPGEHSARAMLQLLQPKAGRIQQLVFKKVAFLGPG